MVFDEALILLDRDLLGGDGEPAGDDDTAGRLVPGDTFRLGRRRAHAELDRSLDHGEGLSLPVDVPAAVAPVLELHQLGIQFLELLLLLPLPQGPFRRPVDAASGSLR